MQVEEGLPKDIRFVLSTIYNFAMEMLQPDQDSSTFWQFRPWLQWWYDLADRLYSHYGILGSAPDPDWFMRPTAVSIETHTPDEILSIISRCQRGSEVSRRRQEFADWSSPSPSVISSEESEELCDAPRSTIQAWIDAQPDTRRSFATSAQYLPPPSALLASNTNPTPRPPSSSLNPLADSFVPNSHGHLSSTGRGAGQRQGNVEECDPETESETVYTDETDRHSSTSTGSTILGSERLDSSRGGSPSIGSSNRYSA